MAAREGRVCLPWYTLQVAFVPVGGPVPLRLGAALIRLTYKEEKANMKLEERLGEVGGRKDGVDTIKLHCGCV